MASSYKIKPANIFGRVGEGFGQGLAQQIPKEIDRYRLQQGLESLSKESEGLTPFQQFARLSSIPGATPQMIESGTNLLRQQAKGNALAQMQNQPAPGTPFPEMKISPPASPLTENAPSTTKPKHLAAVQEGYIPPTQDEIYAEAGRRYNANPALFGNDPQKAIQASEDEALRQEKIFEAHERQHGRLEKIQDNVRLRLSEHSKGQLGAKIPPDLYSKIEDKAIQSTKPESEKGEGLTEQQAIKKYGKEIDEASRRYSDLDSLGGLGMMGTSPAKMMQSLRSTQKEFSSANDTRNMADFMVARNKVSYPLAYAIAEPVSKTPKMSNELKNLPSLSFFTHGGPQRIEETEKIVERLADSLGDASPLAVSYELSKKNYAPQVFLDYLENKYEGPLTQRQREQLRKPINTVGSLNDWWLSSWSGIGE